MIEFIGTATPFPQIHQEQIRTVIEEARVSIEEHGTSLKDERWPFILHHERMKSALRTGGTRLTHSEIYILLSQWAAERDSPHDYAWQVVGGALDWLKIPSNDLPDAVRSSIDAIYGDGDFLAFCRQKIFQIRGAENPKSLRTIS